MAQLVERSLSTPEICGSDPKHSQIFIYQLYIRKDGNKEKEAGNGPSLKTYANVWEAPLSKVIAHYWVETSVSLYKWEEIIVD